MVVQTFLSYLANTWHLALDAAPWLLLGLVAAGMIHALLPADRLYRWLGGKGIGPVLRAAIIGAPLPLCSCGVIPAAVALRRRGASPGATVSFLVATPETGVDSVALSYAMLGPFLTIVRPVAAVLSAVSAGLLSQVLPYRELVDSLSPSTCCDSSDADSNCCGETVIQTPSSDCDCSSSGCCDKDQNDPTQRTGTKLVEGLHFAANDLLDDLGGWLLLGLLLAGAVATFLSPTTLETWGSGLPAMLVMLAVGIPMYICATASTPLAAALLLAGVSPGTVLVFLLAGPATNVATIGILRRELGLVIAGGYVLAIAVSSIALGLATDWVAGVMQLDIRAQTAAATELVPAWLAIGSLVVLVGLAIRPVRRLIFRR